MARRKLSQQQARRIQAQQEQRKRRAQHQEPQDRDSDASELGPEQHGLIIAHHGAALTVEGRDGVQVRCSARRNLGALACGDQVVWQPSGSAEGVVVAVQPRRSQLARPDSSGRQKTFAANLDRIFIVAAAYPEPSEYLIDRYLVTAELTGIAPVIVFNKIDLPDALTLQSLRRRMAVYEQTGYEVLYVSVADAHGLDPLREALAHHTSILVGQSGVGKSSLVKAMLPDQDIRIGALGETRQGRHTTTTALLYHLSGGGDLIDSPGVRDFAVWHIEPAQIAQGYREFAPFLGGCKFSDCSHRHEPGCALLRAVENGHISRQRLQRYLEIMDEVSAFRAS